MKREEFIKWFDSYTSFSKDSISSDYSWRYEVDYANCIWDYVYINENNVEYCWENLYWGGSSLEKREFTFEEFIESYKNDCIKY